MRHVIAVAALLTATTASAAVGAPCGVGSYYTVQQKAANDGTTYTMTAPCFVTFPADFLVTVTASNDPSWPNADVAMFWEVVDTRLDATSAATTLGGGTWVTLDASGVWTRAVRNTYTTGTPVNHRIEFRYQDLGDNPSFPRAHGWSPGMIATVTYDPYPDGTVSDPAPVVTVDPTPVVTPSPDPGTIAGTPATDPSTGCGSTGAVPALLGLVAVVGAAWPRRRTRA